MRARAKKKSRLSCSFCRRDAETVNKLIGGPGVYICDACVDVCNKILGGKTASSHPSDCHGNH